MITKETAKELANAKIEEMKVERANRVADFCLETISPAIEARAEEGGFSIVVGCNSKYADEIATYLLDEGGYKVRIDPITSKTTNLHIDWAD